MLDCSAFVNERHVNELPIVLIIGVATSWSTNTRTDRRHIQGRLLLTKKFERRYYIAASAFYRLWGCGYKAHKTFKDANAFKVELTPIPSRPTTPRRRSSLSGSGKSSGSRLSLGKVDDYDVARLDLRAGLQYSTSHIPSNRIEWLWQCIWVLTWLIFILLQV